MGDLAKYIAEVIEFVVAGILVLFAVLLLGFSIAHPDLRDLPDELPVLGTGGAALPLLGIALIYAIGILAEGVSRRIFEKHLDRTTKISIDTYFDDAEHEGQEGRGVPQDAIRPTDAKGYQRLREDWRMKVMGGSAPLAVQVESQLKRMRIERASALAAGIAALALLVELFRPAGDSGVLARLVSFGAVAAVFAIAVWLSRERHRRYINTIIACQKAMSRAGQR